MVKGLVVTSMEDFVPEKDPPKAKPEVLGVWIRALTSDDEVAARKILEGVRGSLRRYLLQGDFLRECYELESVYQDERLRVPGFRLTRPLSLMVAFGSFKVIALLLEDYQEDMEVCQKDWLENNIFHSLVYLSYLDCNREQAFVEIYKTLIGLLKLEQIKTLLSSENASGRRPLELAAHVGAFQMLAAIFDTKCVYLVKSEVFRTFYEVLWYDVTEYENYYASNRFMISPLLHLVFIDRKRLKAATASKVYATDPFLDWMKKKSQVFLPLMWVWALLRLLFIILLALHDFSEPQTGQLGSGLEHNSTVNSTPGINCNNSYIPMSWGLRTTLMAILMIYCVCVIITDIIEFVSFYIISNNLIAKLPRRRKEYIVLVKVYRINQVVLMTCTLTSLILQTLPNSTLLLVTIKHILYTITWASSIWSLLYFLQLIPFMGYFVITIQNMIADLLRFFILFLLILVPFAFSFHRIARDDPECDERFSNVPRSMYTTFTIMLNMVDVNAAASTPGGDFFSKTVIHLVFVFLVAILLVNFLIALFSQTVSDITDNSEAIIAIQRLSMYWTLEFRLAWLLVNNRFYKRRMEKIFCVRDGRVYITKVLVRCGKPLPAPTAKGTEVCSTNITAQNVITTLQDVQQGF